MNNIQLRTLLTRHSHTSDVFKSCLTADAAPTLITDYPSFYIVNQSTSDEISRGQPGRHWTVLGFIARDKNAEFFDSRCLGLDNYCPQLRRSLMLNGNGKITANTAPYQSSDSDCCGEFCCWFIDMRSLSVPFHHCMHLLSAHDLKRNDFKVCQYVQRHMRNDQ